MPKYTLQTKKIPVIYKGSFLLKLLHQFAKSINIFEVSPVLVQERKDTQYVGPLK